MEQKVNIHNRFDMHIRDVVTGEESSVVAHNLVLNRAYTKDIRRSWWNRYAIFGEGTGQPTASQTNLEKYFGWKEIPGFNYQTPEILNQHTFVLSGSVVLTTSEFVGKQFSEIGLSASTGNAPLFNRALFTDINGNPVSIAKTDTMEITIFYKVFVTIPLQNHLYLNDTYYAQQILMSSSTGVSYHTSNGTSVAVGVDMPAATDATKVTKALKRVEAAEGNSGTGFFTALVSGIGMYYPKMDMSAYAVADIPLGTGNGANKKFHTGMPMNSLIVKQNGQVIPQSAYKYTPFGAWPGDAQRALGTWTLIKGLGCPMSFVNYGNHGGPPGIWIQEGVPMVFEITNGDRIIEQFYSDIPFSQPPPHGSWVQDNKVKLEYSVDGITWNTISHGHGALTDLPVGVKACAIRYTVTANDPNVSRRLWVGMVPLTKTPQLEFIDPPPAGAVLTFSGVPYVIPKTDQFIIDTSLTIDWTP